MDFETLDTEIVFKGRAFRVRRDTVRFPDGHTSQLDIIAHPGAVAILPIDKHKHIWFVQQYRHAIGTLLLELPAGTLESGEPPLYCAHRELREEIGMAAGRMEPLGAFYSTPGFTNEYLYIYLASDLQPSPLPKDTDEYLHLISYPITKVYQMLADGELEDAKTICALALARQRLKENHAKEIDP
jgi:ADP-ribose pyrophosphatase